MTRYANGENGKRALAEWEVKYKEAPPMRYDNACISRLRGLRCKLHYGPFSRYNWRGDPKPCRFPYSDHTSMWKDRNTGQLVYVTQPYPFRETADGAPVLDDEQLQEMNDFCTEYGLKMEIHPDRSWHFPRATTFIMVTKRAKNDV